MSKPSEQAANPSAPGRTTEAKRAQARREHQKGGCWTSGFLADEAAGLRTLATEASSALPFVAILLVAALFTRFFQLGEPGLWMDEIVIYQEAYAGEFKTVSVRSHPLHLRPVGFWMQQFGQTAFGLRFWGALLGALAVPLGALAVLWMAGRAAGLGAGALMLLSPFLLMYAQDGNYYGGMTFYTAVMMGGYAAAMRGAPLAGFAVLLAATAASFKNHPIGALPGGVMLGGAALAQLLFPELRRFWFDRRPAQWIRRPGFPVLAAGAAAGAFAAWRFFPRLAQAMGTYIDIGDTTLTNVEPGFAVLRDHAAAMLVNYWRMAAAERILWVIPAAFLAAGLVLGVRRSLQGGGNALLGLLGLTIIAPLVSYLLIFSIQLNRNFNLRYFTYLVPPLLAVVAVGAVELRRLLGNDSDQEAPWRDGKLLALLALPAAVPAFFVLSYFAADLSNYRGGIQYLERRYEGGPIVAPSRNDRVQAEFYLNQAGLPDSPPRFTYFNSPPYADVFGGSMPFMFHGEESVWLPSAWRHLQADRLYALLDQGLPPVYAGTSKLSPRHDMLLHHWDYGTNVIFPHLAAPAMEAQRPVLRLFPRDAAADGPVAQRLEPGAASGAPTVPELPERVFLRFDDAANAPHHTRLNLLELADGTEVLRNERDDSYDYLVYQPEGAPPRQVVLHAVRRDEDDPLLEKNEGLIEGGHHLSLAVNGRHWGTWFVESGDPEVVRVPVSLELPPGNHRLSVSGFQPRTPYRPYFPWLFRGLEWTAAREPARARLDETNDWVTSGGYPALMPPQMENGKLAGGWQAAGNFELAVDQEMPGPGGEPSLRVEFPPHGGGGGNIFAPPMPVQPGSVAIYWFYYRLDGLWDHEVVPQVILADRQGRRVGGGPVNGANIRGSTYGKGWVRRQVVLPIPQNAALLVPGIMSYKYEGGDSEGGTLWLSAVATPGTAAEFNDPQLPRSYFATVSHSVSGD